MLGDTQRDPSQVDSHTLGQIMQRAHLASTALARELQAQTPVFLSFGRTASKLSVCKYDCSARLRLSDLFVYLFIYYLHSVVFK